MGLDFLASSITILIHGRLQKKTVMMDNIIILLKSLSIIYTTKP